VKVIEKVDLRINKRISQVIKIFNSVSVVDKSMDEQYLKKFILPYFQKSLETKVRKHDSQIGNYNFVDLFAGAGGLSLGLEQVGFVPSIVVDNFEAANHTYIFNRPFFDPSKLISDDIKNVHVEDFQRAPLIVGGPPCQGFSSANKQKKEDDDRNQLYKFFVKSVESVNPKIFLMENVEGILPFKDIIKNDFQNIGYSVRIYRINTSDIGLPQHRKRVFFLGIDNNLSLIHDELYKLFNFEELTIIKKYSLFDAIEDLPKLKAKTLRNSTKLEANDWGYTFGPPHTNDSLFSKTLNGEEMFRFPVLNHKVKFNNDRDIEIYSILKQGEKSDAKSIEHINPYKNRDKVFKDKFYKLVYSEPSKTITAHMYYDCHMYIHPTQSRGLTPREAARIQGFPDDYLFLGSPNEWYRQIGNAVSPILARKIGEKLKLILDRIYKV